VCAAAERFRWRIGAIDTLRSVSNGDFASTVACGRVLRAALARVWALVYDWANMPKQRGCDSQLPQARKA